VYAATAAGGIVLAGAGVGPYQAFAPSASGGAAMGGSIGFLMAFGHQAAGGLALATGSTTAWTVPVDATGTATLASGTATAWTAPVTATGGNTGEIKNDPTMAKIEVQHAIPKSGSDVLKIRRWHRAGTDRTWKIVIGNNTVVVRGKVASFKMDAAPGKGECSFSVEGDEQDAG
jgi:hypothetical protein